MSLVLIVMFSLAPFDRQETDPPPQNISIFYSFFREDILHVCVTGIESCLLSPRSLFSQSVCNVVFRNVNGCIQDHATEGIAAL